ncbi:DNA-binding transcriptional regulator, AcrR family [Evansella caseinilytica]|uniref:DNA-binding transcriptional regulator, AcrR family n=1 Tax=Evansella caseinilytica TaxID=1503961 RepID=A0A1H3L5E5_9BACI|nr:TetR/AcrR family transcriptional regulator [Evansella caseinilytica]SDY59105.1 DNA-binding transcriptional regulator, AcrR family [Evansella caseinilytica]
MGKGKKEIQRARMWRYFLDAATEVIEEEGIQNVTIRKIADKAGYTSSTAYNYFKDLSHLKFFAAMRFTTDYLNELPEYMKRGENTVDKWLYAWECFCKHSFEQPEIYSVIFMDNLGTESEELLSHYYDVYKDDLSGLPETIQAIIMQHHFSTRSALYIQGAVEEGFIEQKDVTLIADMTLMIWKGMMNTYMNRRRTETKQEAAGRTVRFVQECVFRAVNPSRRKELAFNCKYGKDDIGGF